MHSRFAHPGWLAATFAVLLLLFGGSASACPICFSGLRITPGQMIDSADEVVLAVPLDGQGSFRVVAVIKGKLAPGSVIVEPGIRAEGLQPWDMSPRDPAASFVGDKPFLIFRNRIAEHWTSLGAIGEENAGWLRRLASSKRKGEADGPHVWPQPALGWSDLSDAEWTERLAVVVPHLESADPLAAEIAYGELSRAPYTIMRTLKEILDPATVRRWTDDERLALRHPAYLLLLGIVGSPDDAAVLEKRIARAWAEHDATDLSAMIAANLELRGTVRLEEIGAMYLQSERRTIQEIQGALLALSVHGEAGGTIPRQSVVEAYRAFIRARPQMAGFVAKDLSDWNVEDAVPDYLDVARSGAVRDPADQFAIVVYLRQNSDAAANAALAAFATTAN